MAGAAALVALVIRSTGRCYSGICNKQKRMLRWVRSTYGNSVSGSRYWNDSVMTTFRTRALLAQFEDLQDMHTAHRDRLLQQLK